jgi:ribosomal protein S18 acetylase RimI-like enzyme
VNQVSITHRTIYDDTDKLVMASLAAAFSGDNLHVIDLPYRLSSWALDDPQNTCLWHDQDGQLVAWAVLQAPFWTIDFALHPAHTQLFPQVLDWAEQRALACHNTPFDRPAWYVNIFSSQSERIRQLEAAGFACQSDVGQNSWSKVWLHRPESMIVAKTCLPPGFELRPLAGSSEVEAYVALHQAVFETKNMTVAWRQRTLQHPAYTPDLDVIVQAPDGRLAAFCIGWLGTVSDGRPVGQIEPLGCHADFRRNALGRLALAEVLRRMQSLGVAEIYVETDSYRDTAFRLYESLGFQLFRDVLIYCKEFHQEGG